MFDLLPQRRGDCALTFSKSYAVKHYIESIESEQRLASTGSKEYKEDKEDVHDSSSKQEKREMAQAKAGIKISKKRKKAYEVTGKHVRDVISACGEKSLIEEILDRKFKLHKIALHEKREARGEKNHSTSPVSKEELAVHCFYQTKRGVQFINC